VYIQYISIQRWQVALNIINNDEKLLATTYCAT